MCEDNSVKACFPKILLPPLTKLYCHSINEFELCTFIVKKKQTDEPKNNHFRVFGTMVIL